MKNTVLLIIYLTFFCNMAFAQNDVLYKDIEFNSEDICTKTINAQYLGMGKDIYAYDTAVSEALGFITNTSIEFMYDNTSYYLSLYTPLLERIKNIPKESTLQLDVTFYKKIKDYNNNPFAVITNISIIAAADIYENLCFDDATDTKEIQITFLGCNSYIPTSLLPMSSNSLNVKLLSVIYFQHKDNAYVLPSILDCDVLGGIAKFGKAVICVQFYNNLHVNTVDNIPFAVITRAELIN